MSENGTACTMAMIWPTFSREICSQHRLNSPGWLRQKGCSEEERWPGRSPLGYTDEFGNLEG